MLTQASRTSASQSHPQRSHGEFACLFTARLSICLATATGAPALQPLSASLQGDVQQLRKEVDEDIVVRTHTLPEAGPLGQQQLDPRLQFQRGARVRWRHGHLAEEAAILREVLRDESPSGHHVPGDGADDAHDPGEQALNRVVLEENVARPQLGKYATQRPDVHLLLVWQTQDDLRCSIGARLYIGGEPVVHKTGGAKVNELDLATRVRLNKHILRLQVCMDKPQAVHVLQRREQLPCNALQVAQCEVRLLTALAVELGELIEVVSEELSDDDQVLLVVDVVD
eukprot:CAMPEP_0171116082 /NCGR_PEP_ID=MMETSP0766_2-20121228/89492_1 /TAXON_ID=439317 /ORGANISM="Gambierdiscus australes, Strain CAWD 149" /LENGTH=283 /DNA_ID=CAMNT_0011578489 /DNA_START=38 /DNA_END=890 /DNA_ORIENTATION=+